MRQLNQIQWNFMVVLLRKECLAWLYNGAEIRSYRFLLAATPQNASQNDCWYTLIDWVKRCAHCVDRPCGTSPGCEVMIRPHVSLNQFSIGMMNTESGSSAVRPEPSLSVCIDANVLCIPHWKLHRRFGHICLFHITYPY